MKYQAHRGVSSDFPENTMAAFRAAVAQGYDLIETDPTYTTDGVCILFHDRTLDRTCRRADGSSFPAGTQTKACSWSELQTCDAGIWKGEKFRGERIPLLKDLLAYAAQTGIEIKLDNKMQYFTPEQMEDLYGIVERSGAKVGFTFSDPAFIARTVRRLPGVPIHYDGAVSEETLKTVSGLLDGNPLTVWLGLQTTLTSWVKIPFASKELCRLAKQYGELGIWILNTEEDLAAARAFGADLVETTGVQKPPRPLRGCVDCHIHTRFSHDSDSEPEELCRCAEEKGLAGFAVTDHCDIEHAAERDEVTHVFASVKAAAELQANREQIRILRGVELGDPGYYPQTAQTVCRGAEYDVILGSVHTIRHDDGGYTPLARMDFSARTDEEVAADLRRYFTQVEETVDAADFDVLAHLTLPLRYICGKAGKKVDLSDYAEQIDRILQKIVEKGIALEVNTSCADGVYGVWMPDEAVLRRYRELGGYLITLGSDAHAASRVGVGFAGAARRLRALGFPHLYYYQNRVPLQYDPEE